MLKIKDEINEAISKVNSHSQPTFITKEQFEGIEEINQNPQNYEFHLGRTTGSLVLRKKSEIKELNSSHNFVIGVVNCDLNPNFHDRNISPETLKKASINDLEVFDVIHALERLNGANSFELAMIKISNKGEFKIEETYELAQIFQNHCEENKASPTASIYLVCESADLIESDESEELGFKLILAQIPFKEFMENSIDQINLEIISCNTLEKSAEITEELTKIAQKYELKITTHFYDGYVQNNDSFLYISQNERKKLLEQFNLEKTNSIEYESFVESLQTSSLSQKNSPEIEGENTKARTKKSSSSNEILFEEPNQKKSHLIQVIYPGLLIVNAKNIDELKNCIETKNVTIEDDTQQNEEDYHEIINEKIAQKGNKVSKKLVKPAAKINHGDSILWSIDYVKKEPEQDEPDNSPENLDYSTLGQKSKQIQ